MIIENIDGFDYRISFKHDTIQSLPRTTTCVIEKVSSGGRFKTNGVTIATGLAVCNGLDNFNKSIGRKISMRRAMNDSDLNKSARTQIWEAYLGSTPLAACVE